jgi:hypothetical protein
VNSARELLQFNFNASTFARRALQPTQILQQTLDTLEDIIQRHGDTEHEPANREDLRQIYRLFIDAHLTRRLHAEFDSLRRTRQLAWALTYSEDGLPRIVDTSQLNDALRLIENRFSVSALLGVFDAVLQAWDTLNAERLRVFVRRHLTNYEGRRTFVQKLKANMRWYCEENSTTQLAMTLLRSQEKLSEVWKYLELPDYTHSYPYFGAVAEAYIALHRSVNRETLEDIIEFVEQHNNDKTSRSVLSKLIEQLGYEAAEHLRQPLQSYVLREWGDSRITGGAARWRGVSDEAKQIFTRWITREDLRFFFDVVARACNDQKFAYRQAFWLAYLEHISFCRPVLRRNARDLFRNDPQILEYYRERRPATLTGGDSSHHAFIIQMGNHTFVEFSTAAACYIYNNANLPFQLGDPEYDMTELRDQLWADHRVIHHNSENYYWQANFASWINSELEIKPVRSYRLENSDNNETDDVAELIQGLGNQQTWLESSRTLVRIGEPAVPALIDALRAEDHRVRFRAINTLGELGRVAEAAAPMLRQLRIFDPKDYIRDRVNQVLRQINSSYQAEPLRSDRLFR